MLHAEGLTKRFGGRLAVDRLALHVQPGEVELPLGVPAGCGGVSSTMQGSSAAAGSGAGLALSQLLGG